MSVTTNKKTIPLVSKNKKFNADGFGFTVAAPTTGLGSVFTMPTVESTPTSNGGRTVSANPFASQLARVTTPVVTDPLVTTLRIPAVVRTINDLTPLPSNVSAQTFYSAADYAIYKAWADSQHVLVAPDPNDPRNQMHDQVAKPTYDVKPSVNAGIALTLSCDATPNSIAKAISDLNDGANQAASEVANISQNSSSYIFPAGSASAQQSFWTDFQSKCNAQITALNACPVMEPIPDIPITSPLPPPPIDTGGGTGLGGGGGMGGGGGADPNATDTTTPVTPPTTGLSGTTIFIGIAVVLGLYFLIKD